jgi:hypothetical protein
MRKQMTLKEKIDDSLFYIEPKITITKLEKVAEEFAIGFGEYLDSLTAEDMGDLSIKKILEIYKTAKQL